VRFRDRLLVKDESEDGTRIELSDERLVTFADEPDIAIYKNDLIQSAVEIKGGIDPASALERVGAAIKSLRRARKENPQSITILILQEMLVTERAKADLKMNKQAVKHWITVEEIIENESKREEIFSLLGI